MPSVSVNVHADHRGAWEVLLSDDERPVRCETLAEAERVALRVAPRAQPCDLVVHDAYERVIRHDMLEPEHAAGSGRR